MERLYIYNSALAVVGLSVGFPAAQPIISGNYSISTLLMGIGGSGMIIGAGYESLRTNPDEFNVSATALFTVVGAACVSLLGTVLSIV